MGAEVEVLRSSFSEVEIVAAELDLDLRSSDEATILCDEEEPSASEFVPFVRSGCFADVGPRRLMEDQHIIIDDLAGQLGPSFTCPSPFAFYGVFDGHGGADAAEYVKKNALRIFFEDAEFPRSTEADEEFLDHVTSSIRRAFLLADDALADDCSVCSSSGTTALTALVLGRALVVANAGDCRAVLCRDGEAVELSSDHRPTDAAERCRLEAAGGTVDDAGYLNGVLSLSRALGDWDLKPPLTAEPELRHFLLRPGHDEFLILACDGVWDVMSSAHAVGIVRRGLRRHDDPSKCARELVMEALRLRTFDNLTAIVVCFTPEHHERAAATLRYCSLSAQALSQLKTWICDNAPSR
ncbi:putative protein phosphatase 2C 2 [Wolffia australiana]